MLLCLSCKENTPTQAEDTATESGTQEVQRQAGQAASTAQMAARLAEAYSKIDPAQANVLASAERIALYQQQMQSTDLGKRLSATYSHAYELLNAGQTEQTITQMQMLLDEVKNYRLPEQTMLQFRRLVAIAYLRLGEQANCINTRTPASCILPFTPEAQYRLTEGSETAMRICIEILQDFPGDEETIWILNLAAMTIGKYPDGVPQRWRIPEAHFASGARFAKFADISRKAGIKGASMAGGVIIEDFDGDGWLDIMTSSWGKHDHLVLWKNNGNGTFSNISEGMGLKGITGGLNMIHADINNDGLPDVLVLRGAWLFDQGNIPNSMLLNLGNGAFRDVTEEAGLLTYAPTQTAVFADFNLDGWIDLFIGNESSSMRAYPSEFYLNNGDGTFRNVTNRIGVNTQIFVKGVTTGDINNDGWPDLYLSNYRGANMLLLHKGLNADGIPQFENIASAAGVEEPMISFPTWFWDFDNDGWDDIFVSAYGKGPLTVAKDFVHNAKGVQLDAHPRMYRNKGNNTFADVTRAVGLTDNIYTMGCNYGDLDADGYLDFYLGTGAPEYTSVVPNKMFRNNSGKRFDDITAAGGFGHIQKGHGVAFGDLDRDGDEDIFHVLGGAYDGDLAENVLFENPIGQNRSWTVLQLYGVSSNRLAIGARVKITLDTPGGTRILYRTVSTGSSFGTNSLQLEVGLGDATAIREIEVRWPVKAQTVQVYRNVRINTYLRITEGLEVIEYLDFKPAVFSR